MEDKEEIESHINNNVLKGNLIMDPEPNHPKDPRLWIPNGHQIMKSIHRRGNTYMISELISVDSEEETMNEYERMSNDLYKDAIKKSGAAGRKSSFLKILNGLLSMLVIILGIIVGVLTPSANSHNDAIFYTVGVLGFLISGIKTFLIAFSIDKRGVLLKDVSIRIRKLARDIKKLEMADYDQSVKLRKLDELYSEMDELDMSMYDHSITELSVERSTNVISNSSTRKENSASNRITNFFKRKRKTESEENTPEIPNVDNIV